MSIDQKLNDFVKKNNFKYIIWDFDLVIYKLDWTRGETSHQFLTRLYKIFHEVDPDLINDKDEFIYRLFPYTEIDLYSKKYGKSAVKKVIDLFQERELNGIDYAVANNSVIDFIKSTDKNIKHAIWSNNNLQTIEYLLKKSKIENEFVTIATLDNVQFPKPDISGFETIYADFNNPDKSKILMVGDSLRSDKVAAENAGIAFFHYNKPL
jgi:5'-nucleotidase